MGRLGSVLWASWSVLGRLGGFLGRLEGILGRLGRVSERLGGVSATSCPRLGPGASWSVLGASGRRLGASGARLGAIQSVLAAPKRERGSGRPAPAGRQEQTNIKEKSTTTELYIQISTELYKTALQRTQTRSWAPSGPVRIQRAAELRTRHRA